MKIQCISFIILYLLTSSCGNSLSPQAEAGLLGSKIWNRDAFKLFGHKAKDLLNEGLHHGRMIDSNQSKALLQALRSHDRERNFVAECKKQDPKSGEKYARRLLEQHNAALALIKKYPQLLELHSETIKYVFERSRNFPTDIVPVEKFVPSIGSCVSAEKLKCIQMYQKSEESVIERYDRSLAQYMIHLISETKSKSKEEKKILQSMLYADNSIVYIEQQRQQFYSLLELSRNNLKACFSN